jgi:bis(5'-nucleosyl)-tetraphosphatase (symmetrical)
MPPEGRRIFVGDIQGCRLELEQLLDAAGFRPGEDELHPVGDFVNRGPDNVGVLRLCRELDAGGVLGNHDLHALRARAGKRRENPHDTLDDLAQAADGDALLDWLAGRPFVRAWEDVTLVHAALHPQWKNPAEKLAGLDPLEPHPLVDFATRVRFCDQDGERPEADHPEPGAPFRPWYEFLPESWRAGHTVVFGHWSRAGLVVRPGLRGLDTGCVWGGLLTAWIAEENRLVQVDAARSYSPFS